MKSIVLVLLAFFSAASFAAKTTEIRCSYASNADYVLRLTVDAKGVISQVALYNDDWGAAGVGDQQTVSQTSTDVYAVITEAKSLTGLDKAASLQIVRDAAKKIKAVSVSELGAKFTADYTNCN